MDHRENRYFLYARKSSESEDRQMASIDDQIREVKRLADEQGLNIIDTITESKSAKAPGRKAFNDMLLRIEKGDAEGILCWKLNRLARNPVDGGKISWMLQNGIVKHIQCHGRGYLPSDNVLMMQVELGMANQFIKDLSTDVKRGMRNKAERGWYPAGLPPVGYMHHKDRKGRVGPIEIIIDKKRFPIVKQLWKMMLTGNFTISDVIRKAEKLGLRNEKKQPYSTASFYKMFRCKFYCGYFNWSDENGQVKEYTGKHQRMISVAEFEKVQRILGVKAITKRERTYSFPFKGSLSCGECTSPITAERKFQVRCTTCKKKFSCISTDTCKACETKISEMDQPNFVDITYYRCTKNRGICSQPYISEPKLKIQYQKFAKEISISKKHYDMLIEELENYTMSKDKENLSMIQTLESQKTELENRLKGLALMRADGDVSREEYMEIKSRTLDEIVEKKVQIDEIRHRCYNWKEIVKSHLEVVVNAEKILNEGSDDAISELLPRLGSNQHLLDKTLYISRPKTIEALCKVLSSNEGKKGTFEPENPLIIKEILREITT